MKPEDFTPTCCNCHGEYQEPEEKIYLRQWIFPRLSTEGEQVDCRSVGYICDNCTVTNWAWKVAEDDRPLD